MAETTRSRARKAGSEFQTAMDAFTASLPNFEIPAAWREAAEKGAGQARDAYERMRAAAEASTEIAEATFSTARDGAATINLKALEATRANAEASFAFLRDLFGVKTFAEAVELQATFARKQFDAVSAQVKEFNDLTQKVLVETTTPGRDAFQKAFKDLGLAA